MKIFIVFIRFGVRASNNNNKKKNKTFRKVKLRLA